MTKILCCNFIFIIILLSAQTYDFNKEVIYIFENGNRKSESIIYVNTKNDTYYLKIFRNEEKSFARLYDFKKNRIHHYDLIEIKGRNDKFDLKYIDSERYYDHLGMNYNSYGYEFLENSGKNLLNIYQTKKKKKIYKNFEFETEENEENLFPAFRISCLHPFEYNNQLTFNKNVVVKKSKITYKENTCDCNLKKIENINFTLNIP